jgi:1,4-dihydroxy-2-naphthoyl-CoA hydrolase
LSIWKITPPSLPLPPSSSLNDHLDIRIVEIGADYVIARMPVDERTRRSRGFLHGGASAALAETVGGFAAQLCVEADEYCVGQQINANHIRKAFSGFVHATATPVHIGATSQVWDIRIVDSEQRTVCMSRLTLAVLKR